MRYAARADRNQKQIMYELRALGYSVRTTHRIGQGFPDLAVGKFSRTVLVELKMPGEPLTADEHEFFDTWTGAAIVATTAEQVHEQFMKLMEEGSLA